MGGVAGGGASAGEVGRGVAHSGTTPPQVHELKEANDPLLNRWPQTDGPAIRCINIPARLVTNDIMLALLLHNSLQKYTKLQQVGLKGCTMLY